MINITKEFSFDMAHILEDHPSKCKNLHGHTYKLFVTISRDELKNNMVIDFADVKEIVNELVNQLDHSFAYNKNTDKKYVREIADILKKNNLKVFEFENRTTCEEMSKFIFKILDKKFNEIDIDLLEICLYEGPGSYAKYRKY